MTAKRLLQPLLLIAIFAAGLAGGAYYHRELTVVVNHLKTQVGGSVAPPAAPAAKSEASDSTVTLRMAQLADPLPLIFSDTLEEDQVQEYLKQGAVVLPLGTSFGDPGNVVITAHSSGTAAFGPYRFAFAKLSELTENQEFTVNTPAAAYTYRVYGQEIVWPHEVDKLPNDDRSTVTLVTCWPLWTNFKRLLVHAELISTDYKL